MLNGDQVVEITMLSSCENFIRKRQKFVFNTFINILNQWRDFRIGEM